MDGSRWRAIALLFRLAGLCAPGRDGPELSPLYPLLSGLRSQLTFLSRQSGQSRGYPPSLDTFGRFTGYNRDNVPTIGKHGQSE